MLEMASVLGRKVLEMEGRKVLVSVGRRVVERVLVLGAQEATSGIQLLGRPWKCAAVHTLQNLTLKEKEVMLQSTGGGMTRERM